METDETEACPDAPDTHLRGGWRYKHEWVFRCIDSMGIVEYFYCKWCLVEREKMA